MESGRIVVGVALSAAIVTGAGIALRRARDPMRRGAEGIRAWLLSEAPVGSQVETVRAVIAGHGWSQWAVEYPDGCVCAKKHPGKGCETVGTKSFVGNIGSDGEEMVHACWAINAQGVLEDLYVSKHAVHFDIF